ncbi:MAG: hypothetical protein K2L84_06285 [Muribaculaceae bacterium]|nr:hypothetical protein [Muribaculaceae bacterium]
MKITLTRAQMLEQARIATRMADLRADCAIEFTDGIDIDVLLAQKLRGRYLELLDRGARELVAADNIAATVSVSADAPGGGVRLTPPAMCRRVFAVKMRGWERAAEVLPASLFRKILSRQLNPYTAATAANPVAVLDGDSLAGSSPSVVVWPAIEGDNKTDYFNAATDSGEDFYTFDEAALPYMLDKLL